MNIADYAIIIVWDEICQKWDEICFDVKKWDEICVGRNLCGTKSVKIARGTKSVWDEICHSPFPSNKSMFVKFCDLKSCS